jgi:hypothetical protein
VKKTYWGELKETVYESDSESVPEEESKDDGYGNLQISEESEPDQDFYKQGEEDLGSLMTGVKDLIKDVYAEPKAEEVVLEKT